jgi:hypothetical protein
MTQAANLGALGTNAGTTGVLTSAALPTGSVLQVVNATYSTQINTTGATFIDTGLTASITPKFSTSKVLCIVNMVGVGKDTTNTWASFKLLRGSTTIITFEAQAGWTNSTGTNGVGGVSTNYLDSPATTSATTYKVQYANQIGTGNVYAQLANASSTITLMEIA